MKIFSEDCQCFVDMEYDLTINIVDEFKKDISPLISTDKKFLIHCIDLKEIDSAGLQILISLKKQLEKEEKIFELTAGLKLKNIITFFMLDKYFAGDIV